MENFDIIAVTPAIYERALAEVKRGHPPPDSIALAIVEGMTTLRTQMHEREMTCALCDPADAYEFTTAEPPDEFILCIPSPGSHPDTVPMVAPVCPVCARLSDKDKQAKVATWLERTFSGAHPIKPN